MTGPAGRSTSPAVPAPTSTVAPPFSNSCFSQLLQASAATEEEHQDTLLPAAYQDAAYQVWRPQDELKSFLHSDLAIVRLDQIHPYLWLAGRPMPARPLHRQLMMERRIVVTEQVDLHLVWSDGRIFIKPLPAYLLDHAFWTEHLCNDGPLHESACGFLLSYIWLIGRESDFQIATTSDLTPRLIPAGVTWAKWRSMVKEVLGESLGSNGDAVVSVIDRRYRFGELRLGRLNLIYRLAPAFQLGYLIRGYHFDYRQYNVFFRQNSLWLIIVFAYVSVVLAAMQVGLATDRLNQNDRFNSASYGFALFSIVVPAVAVGVIVLLFAVLFLNNLQASWLFYRQQKGGWKKDQGDSPGSK